MNIWKVIGEIFLGCASVVLIYAVLAFFIIVSTTSQIPFVGQVLSSVALPVTAPYFVLAAFMYVIGGVTYHAGSENSPPPLTSSNKGDLTANNMLDRLNRLEEVVDDNFKVITDRLTELEVEQYLASQSTIVKANKE